MDLRGGGTRDDAVSLLYTAQRHAGALVGRKLVEAADWVSSLAVSKNWSILSCDCSGERILGAAATKDSVDIIDSSRRFDGRDVLLVAGMVAGPAGLARSARIARSKGATSVHCAYLGGWEGVVAGVESTHIFAANQNEQLGAMTS